MEELAALGHANDPPRILKTYLFCATFKCLPKAGGYYDQDYTDMQGFMLIEERLSNIRGRAADDKGAGV